jgi:hypothetical protein
MESGPLSTAPFLTFVLPSNLINLYYEKIWDFMWFIR